MRNIVAHFLVRYPKVNVVAHAADQNADIVGENYDIAEADIGQAPSAWCLVWSRQRRWPIRPAPRLKPEGE